MTAMLCSPVWVAGNLRVGYDVCTLTYRLKKNHFTMRGVQANYKHESVCKFQL